ncbi:glycosyltransferase [Halobacteriovorax sp.]|uniref:glycosyltransferase n=1 Tax=Halobacteriovorax sp. TaxID=2020862 RepID=UPI003566C33C
MSIKNILWVVPKYTFPVADGARVASNSLVQSFNSTKHKFDVLSLVDNGEQCINEYKEKWKASSVFLISRSAPKTKATKLAYWFLKILKNPFSPLTLSYFNDKGVVNEVKRTVDVDKYDVIIFDGLHGYASLENSLISYKGKIIYRAHNVEQDLWFTAADKTKNYLLSLFYKFQGHLMAKFENNLIQRSFVTWTISNEDHIRFKAEVPASKFSTIPVGMDFSKELKSNVTESSLQLFFLGRLDWAPNKEGLKWFLEKVWPILLKKRNDLVLNIGGSGNGEWLRPYLSMNNLRFHGLIDDLESTYESMDLAIMPIFFGSGTRIKVIESVCHGLPLISTSMGVQGSELLEDHYYHAETADQWISMLSSLQRVDLKNKGDIAREHLKSILDYSAITNLIEKSL